MNTIEKSYRNYLLSCEKRKKLSWHTLKVYRIDLEQYKVFCCGISIDKEVLGKYMQYLVDLYKPKTAKRKIAVLKAFFHYLYYQDIIDSNPFDKINTHFKELMTLPKTIPRHIIKDIIEILYVNSNNTKNAYQTRANIRNAAIIELLFATGARGSEICNLKKTDVDLTSRTIKIFGKGSKKRIIQIENENVRAILKRYINEFSNYL